MGLCTSCEATSVATAKLVLQDGRLQEYSYPVRVSYILAKDPNIFVCNADDMEFDDVLTAVREEDELEPGQLYFALPRSKLRRTLQPEEMAALAVKANAALVKSGGGEKCGCRKKGGFGFFDGKSTTASAKVADVGSAGRRGSGNRRRNNGGRKMFMANLSVIAE